MRHCIHIFTALIAISLLTIPSLAHTSAGLHPKLFQLHYEQGLHHYQEGDRDAARSDFLMALYLNPDHPETNYYLGLIAHSDSQHTSAIAFMERAREHMLGNIELLYWLGNAYWDKNLAEGAIRSYRAAVDADPNQKHRFSLYALENLAEVYTRADRLQESLDAYQAALDRETRSAWIEKINNQIAELHLTMGTYEDDGNGRYNDQGEIIGGVGQGDMRTNHYFEVARHTMDPVKESTYYRKAIAADPTMYQSHFNLGWALTKQGRYAEAVPAFTESDVIWRQDSTWNPDGSPKVDAHAFLALTYVELGQPEKALEYADIALQLQPNYYYGLLYKARALTSTGRPDESISILAGLVETNPDEAEALYALYTAYHLADRPTEASAALAQAVYAQVDRHKKARWAEELSTLHRSITSSTP